MAIQGQITLSLFAICAVDRAHDGIYQLDMKAQPKPRAKRVIHAVAFAAACVVALPCAASAESAVQQSAIDQQQRLDVLFGKLRDKTAGESAFQTEQAIWALWMQSDSAEDDRILAQAASAMAGSDFRTSETLLNELVAKTPGYAEAWNKRATLYYLVGRYEESLADIVKTLDLEPRHFGALSGRGMILMRQGKMKDALIAYKEAQAINPHMPGVAAAIRQLEAAMPDL
jgi:Flp pilus assembly protein TadD